MVKWMKRVSQDTLSEPQVLAGTPLLVAICLGSACFVLLALVSVCFVLRRRSQRQYGQGSLKQFLLPKNVKPVIGFKTAAGPGGLKKSPSPLQSPEGMENEWAARSTHPGILELSLTDSQTSHSSGHDSMTGSVTEQSLQRINLDELGEKRGELNFSLRYCFEKNALQVNIIGATNLPQLVINRAATGEQPLLDPYVKLQLLPEKQHKVKTRVVRNTLNPVYDEEFTFYGITYSQLQSTTLHFAVVAFDRYSRDEIVGEVLCPLHTTVDLSDSDRQATLTMDLVSRSSRFQNSQNRGEILVSLCYQPATNKVTAVVLKAKNLPKFDITGLADPYVKVYMLYNGQKVAKKKTHVKKRTLTPVYNESFVFDLPSSDPSDLELVSFELVVMDWDRVTKNEVMGRCMVGIGAKNSSGRSHWDQVRRNPRRQIAEWHRLRP
uniref:C2 domain-containing protein n=1 Tax=Plectus sambesii TaxID=2011161 RepID=A0A914VQV2_9BILA